MKNFLPPNSSPRIGLARALSKLGYCSRSQASACIRAGRVLLNDVVRRDPETPVRMEKDRIAVDGVRLAASAKVYLMLNKKRGVVVTASDEKGRETIYASIAKDYPAHSWIAPVGRLDKASEGLLLLTNDSEWSARVLAPGTHLEKTYHVQVAAVVSAALTESLVKGVAMCDSEILRARAARTLRCGGRNTWLEIVLDEGKNRQIRRMLGHFGLEVKRLLRVAIGPLPLGELAKGAVRPLTEKEKLMLDQAMKQKAASIKNELKRKKSRRAGEDSGTTSRSAPRFA